MLLWMKMKDLSDGTVLVSVSVIVGEIDTQMDPPMYSGAQNPRYCYVLARFLAPERPRVGVC